jgi:glycosyltransferase involved in cell wall biosynthesis
MRVIALTKTSSIGPSSRYRYIQYRERLAALGVELDVRPLFGPGWFRILRVRPAPLRFLLKCGYVPVRFAARLLQLAGTGRADLTVVEHQALPYLPPLIERWLSRSGRRWSLEFDDAIWLTRGHRAKLERMCALADRVLVGNRYLATFAARWNEKVAVVPTTIDLRRYPAPARPVGADAGQGARPLVIGWIGLPYNFDALKILARPLRRLTDGSAQTVLRVVSAGRSAPAGLDGVKVEMREWALEREVADISAFDIGVMPLHDDEWSRGKCGLKILQCFAAGVPVVASPVGVNAEIVADGVNGFLARDEDEWSDRLARLARDPELRRRLGDAGRRTVEERYSTDAWAPRLAAAWRSVAKAGAAGGAP